MENMGKVFNLPLVVDGDNDISIGNGDWILINPSAPEHIGAHVAHAINHVDALAEALDFLIQECGKVYSNSSSLGDAELRAKIALTNYRGEL